ncbi:MAG: molybdate ABC transporter permease subunit, partial [Pseudomonadota bacterium]
MPDLGPFVLTLQLAAITTVILFALGVPLAWWLATTQSRMKPVIEAVTALPLVLPPTVIGFYLLVLLSPNTPLGSAWVTLTGDQLTFSFTGLVVASVIYSLPFMVQPLQSAFESVGRGPMEAAGTLGASQLDAFATVVLPLSARGFLTAGILSFAHTIGEFGVVIMVGGA